MAGSLKVNLEEIKKKIQSEVSLGHNFPLIIAVSKKQDVVKIKELYEMGVHDFAENYVQEFKVKMKSLKKLKICWHFIGQIQSKKLKDIVGCFDYIHSLDRRDIAEKISDKCSELGITQKVLVQVNIAGENTKQGLHPDELMPFLELLKTYPNLQVCGLMIFPPLCENDEENLHWFEKGKALFDKAKIFSGENFKHLSMGTSQNYHLAARKGASMLRIGESLMGSRN